MQFRQGRANSGYQRVDPLTSLRSMPSEFAGEYLRECMVWVRSTMGSTKIDKASDRGNVVQKKGGPGTLADCKDARSSTSRIEKSSPPCFM